MQRLFSPMLAIYGLHVNCPYEISISIWTKKSVVAGCFLPFFSFQLSLICSVSSLFCILCHLKDFFKFHFSFGLLVVGCQASLHVA